MDKDNNIRVIKLSSIVPVLIFAFAGTLLYQAIMNPGFLKFGNLFGTPVAEALRFLDDSYEKLPMFGVNIDVHEDGWEEALVNVPEGDEYWVNVDINSYYHSGFEGTVDEYALEIAKLPEEANLMLHLSEKLLDKSDYCTLEHWEENVDEDCLYEYINDYISRVDQLLSNEIISGKVSGVEFWDEPDVLHTEILPKNLAIISNNIIPVINSYTETIVYGGFGSDPVEILKYIAALEKADMHAAITAISVHAYLEASGEETNYTLLNNLNAPIWFTEYGDKCEEGCLALQEYLDEGSRVADEHHAVAMWYVLPKSDGALCCYRRGLG